MEFITLNQLVFNLLNIIRGGKITDDEPISKRQLELFVHQYRAKLLKQDIDKGKYINPDYIQEYENTDGSALAIVPEEQELRTIYRTSVQIPKTIDLNYQSGILFVGDVEGNRIQLVPENRINYQQYKKHTKKNILAYLKDRYIYLHNHNGLQYIRLRGLFEIPTELPNMDLDSKYPIPLNMVDVIMKMILKNELEIEWNASDDDKNDTDHNITSDVKN